MDQALANITDRIREAIAQRTALHIRGGGSKDFYGGHVRGELLDGRTLAGIRSYEPSELVVTAGAGTPLAELEATLAEKGQCLPFEPPHYSWSGLRQATVGGMVASGLAGPARASVGGVRDYVLGLQMVNGQAQTLVFGGQVMKNVAGYDVSRLMVGAMGTLGLLTEVSLKVLPIAPAQATLCFELTQDRALEQLHTWGAQPLPLNASCWVHDDTASGGARDLLFVRLRGAVAAVDAASRRMLAELQGQTVAPEQAHGDWLRCRDHQLPFFIKPPAADAVLWRLSLPQTAPALELPGPQLVEWHGALRWLWAPADSAVALQAQVRQHGGSATVFVAPSSYLTGATEQFVPENAAAKAIQQRLKERFDPLGIFNPGRML